MLNITSEQVTAFRSEAKRRLALQLVPEIRQHLPNTVKGLTDESLLNRARPYLMPLQFWRDRSSDHA